MNKLEMAKSLQDAAEYPRNYSLEEWSVIYAARAAARQAWLNRYLEAMGVALATARAKPDHRIIVEYLAECSNHGLEHIFLETLLANVLERGCTLTSACVRTFLEQDLRLNIWSYRGDVMVRTPHDWTPECGSYPLDVEGIWESWVWCSSADSDWANHCWGAAADLQEFMRYLPPSRCFPPFSSIDFA